MSEKELRSCLQWAGTLDMGLQRDPTLVRHAERSKWVVTSNKALDDEPDVVKVLRDLVKDAEKLQSNYDLGMATRRSAERTSELWGQLQYVRSLIVGLKGTFGVRLTDDGGWEWVEEE